MVQFRAGALEQAVDEVLRDLAPDTMAAPREALLRYVGSLARFGAHTDLVGARTPGALVEIALADALVLARHAELVTGPAWEVGAGGASLLVPLALLDPALTGCLVEPRQKRATFLRLAIGQLGLGARLTVEQQRVDPENPPRAVAGLVLGRAVFGPESWVPLASTMVRPIGLLVVLGTEALEPREGLSVAACERYALPLSGARRVATWLRRDPGATCPAPSP